MAKNYSEPIGFFPESVRKKNKIGEYAEEEKKDDKKKDELKDIIKGKK